MYPRSRLWLCVSVSYNGWLCSNSTSLCVVIQNFVLSATHAHSPSDLLMVHTVCDTQWALLTDSCHADSGCLAWPAYKPTTQLDRQNWNRNCRLILEYIQYRWANEDDETGQYLSPDYVALTTLHHLHQPVWLFPLWHSLYLSYTHTCLV